MAELTANTIFARNTMPSLSISNTSAKPPTNVSGTNPYTNLNVTQDPTKVTNAANSLAGTLDAPIQGLKDLSTIKTDTSGAPNTSLQGARDKISNIAASGVTKETMNKFASLRPENKYEGQMDTALSRLDDYSSGDSKVDRTLANRYLTKFDASSAAANMAQSQRIASNPYLTAGAKNAAMQELNRTASSQRSELVGGLAEKAQERAYAATKDYANMTLQAAEFKENQYKTDLSAATQEVTNNLNAAIAEGNLSAQEISNNINVWNTKVNAQIQDLSRSLEALTKSGQLTVEQAGIKMNGILESSRIEGQNITNDLLKAKGIAEFAGQEATIKSIEATILAQKNETYKSNNGLLTEALLSYREEFQGTDKDNAEDAINNPKIRMYLDNTWKSIPGNENIPMDEDWAKAYYNSINTASETKKQATEATIRSLRSTWVGTNPGQMTEQAFDNVANTMRMVADFGGSVARSADGKTISIVGADGKPMIDSNGESYSWDSDGNRVKPTETTGTSIETFNTWKTKNLLSSDTEDYSDTEVFNAYNKLVSEGKTPTRDNILNSLKTNVTNTKTTPTITDTKYEKIIDDYSLVDTLGVDNGEGYLETSVDKTKLADIYNYETSNPDKAKFVSNIDISKIQNDVLTPSFIEGMKNYSNEQKYDAIRFETYPQIKRSLEESKGKFISYLGKPVVNLGMSGDKYVLFDLATGNKIYKNLTEITTETAKQILDKTPGIETVETMYAKATPEQKTKMIEQIKTSPLYNESSRAKLLATLEGK